MRSRRSRRIPPLTSISKPQRKGVRHEPGAADGPRGFADRFNQFGDDFGSTSVLDEAVDFFGMI